MRRIHGPSPFLGGNMRLCIWRTPREKTLQEITDGRIWTHPGVVLREQDRLPRRWRR